MGENVSTLPSEKTGSVRLLQEVDLAANNAFGKPLVGWKQTSQGVGGLANFGGGWAMIRVVVRKLINGVMKDLYDQPMIIEKPGSIVICRYDDKVALIPNFRMTGERLPPANNKYIDHLNEGRWDDMLANLGEWRWELPAGLANIVEGIDLPSTVLGAAQAEALQEAGLRVIKARIIGRVNMNPTFFPHPQYVVEAKVDKVDDARPENLEIIGKVRFVTASELREICTKGEMEDSKSLAALALAGFHF